MTFALLTSPLPLARFSNEFPVEVMFFVFFGVLAVAFHIWMIVDCATREPDQGNTKVIWLLVILLAPLGSLIYFFARKLQRASLPPPPGPRFRP